MSEVELRKAYYHDRVLIEAERVFDPQFADSLICLTGEDLELLRNLTTYLHCRATFVGVYYDGYYLMPDDEDWDDLQAIVASLEEKLMGCTELEALITSIAEGLAAYPLLGKPTVLSECIYTVCDTTGNMYVELPTVPENTIRTCSRLVAYDVEAAPSFIRFDFVDQEQSGWRFAEKFTSPQAYVPVGWTHEVVMMPEEQWRVCYNGAFIGNNLRTTIVALDRLIVE